MTHFQTVTKYIYHLIERVAHNLAGAMESTATEHKVYKGTTIVYSIPESCAHEASIGIITMSAAPQTNLDRTIL